MRVGFYCIVVLILLGGCATVQRPSDIPEGIVSSKMLALPFIEQESGYCGPATLAMVMQGLGLDVNAERLGSEVYIPGKKGSLQTDMISAGRRHGLMAIQIEGMNQLLTEVASGHPVIVFENLGLSWYPRWHYSVVVGYDLARDEIIEHTGPNAYKPWRMRRFERAWGLGRYWGLVLLPAGQLTASAGELAHVRAAAGLEAAGKPDQADLAYQSILARWPSSLGALVGSANLAYQRNDSRAAVRLLRKATQLHPESVIARHNLDVAEKALKQTEI